MIVKRPNPNRKEAAIELSILRYTVHPIPIKTPATIAFFNAFKCFIIPPIFFCNKFQRLVYHRFEQVCRKNNKNIKFLPDKATKEGSLISN